MIKMILLVILAIISPLILLALFIWISSFGDVFYEEPVIRTAIKDEHKNEQ